MDFISLVPGLILLNADRKKITSGVGKKSLKIGTL